MGHIGKICFLHMRKQDADQLHGNSTVDQCLCFHCTASTIPLLPTSEIQASGHLLVLAVQTGLYQTWWETPDSFSCDAALIVRNHNHLELPLFVGHLLLL